MTPHRRAFVAGALGLATVPTLAKATVPMTKFQVLEAVIAAWKKQDVEGVLAHVTDDIVWRNSGGFAPAIRGKAAMRQALTAMAAKIKTNAWRIFDYAENDHRLFMEGVDEFWFHTGEHIAIPYAGSLEFRGELIREWREYFDGRLSIAMKNGEPLSDEVKEMIGRPVAR
ncbi:limonene-1,2-epoxide hydrolase family protein [Caulobacter sp. SSI4214]|uniref:nuclear transport factor 2 family protein n=1 Tax=Caulobacter sp. SSI4214 TaxID=2575739 RepID=UPI00143870C8|nr:limonene-1,2-epoxide hydrolase family protein [Caulobacter sp. SSI4214]